jgi:hypothetical protein
MYGHNKLERLTTLGQNGVTFTKLAYWALLIYKENEVLSFVNTALNPGN